MLKRFPQFEFSVSATSRAPRGCERHGCDYHFMTHEEFMRAVAENRFVEWEEVYQGTCYGTLRSEVERIWAKGNIIVLGELKGTAAAGMAGNREAVVVALEMAPTQIRISDATSRFNEKNKRLGRGPMIASVEQDEVLIRPIKKTFLNNMLNFT
mgnify:CR=1 FL=1